MIFLIEILLIKYKNVILKFLSEIRYFFKLGYLKKNSIIQNTNKLGVIGDTKNSLKIFFNKVKKAYLDFSNLLEIYRM